MPKAHGRMQFCCKEGCTSLLNLATFARTKVDRLKQKAAFNEAVEARCGTESSFCFVSSRPRG